jgi:hypothetical protein
MLFAARDFRLSAGLHKKAVMHGASHAIGMWGLISKIESTEIFPKQ